MIVDELISLLGLRADPGNEGVARGFMGLLSGIRTAAKLVATALAAAATAVTAYATHTAKATAAGGRFADSVNLTFQRLQELEYAAGAVGGSTEELRGDLDRLNSSMTSLIPGEYNKGLYMLGVSARDASGKVRNVDQVLLDVADRLQGMDARRQNQFAEMLGLSPTSLMLIRKGREGVEQLTAEARDLGIILDDAARVRAEKFNAAMFRTRAVVTGLAQTLAIGLLPGLAEGLESFTDWVRANGDFIQMGVDQTLRGIAEGFDLVSDAADTLFGWVGDLFGGFVKLDKEIDATGAIAIAVAAGITAATLAVAAAYWPIILITVAIGALVLIAEDLYNAFKGQPSLVGEWASSFEKAYPKISAALGKILDILGEVFAFLGGVGAAVLEGLVGAFGVVLTYVGSSVTDLLTAIESALSGANPFDVLVEYFKATRDRIVALATGITGAMFNPLHSFIEGIMPTGGFFGDNGIFGGGATTSTVPANVINNSGGNSTTNLTQNISGAGNPAAVASSAIQQAGMAGVVMQGQPGRQGATVK